MVEGKMFIDADRGACRTTIQEVELDKLRLDPSNVRFLHLNRILTDPEIEEEIWNEPDTKVLFRQIVGSGGLSERPYVTKDYLVVEGNRRVVCLRHARDMHRKGEINGRLPKDAFEKVEVEVLEENVSPQDIDVFLVRTHITGKKEWDALNQAHKIWLMHQKQGVPLDKIKELCGMSKGKVLQKVKSYEATVEYLQKTEDEDIKKYSYFEELYKRKDLRSKMFEPEFMAKFRDWLANERFDMHGAIDVRLLPSVMDDDNAFSVFTSEGMTKAFGELQKKDPTLSSRAFRLLKEATEALKTMPRNEYEAIATDKSRLMILKMLRMEIDRTFKSLGIRIDK